MTVQCDLCDSDAEYYLCQEHLDGMRYPDVFSTIRDNEYPRQGEQVVFEAGGVRYIGKYDHEKRHWITQNGYEFDIGSPVLWFYLPSLSHMYEVMRRKHDQK